MFPNFYSGVIRTLQLTWVRTLVFAVLNLAAMSHVYSESVLSTITSDWNNDGEDDIATLLRESVDDEFAKLKITLSSTIENTSQIVEKEQFAWDGEAPGTSASLSINKSGSLVISTENASIGRDRWSQNVVIAFRENRLIIAGFLHKTIDAVTGEKSVCDVNLLTGTGYTNSEYFEFAIRKLTIDEWNDDIIEKLCRR